MSGRVSDYLVQKWLTTIQSGWLALHHDNPDVAGAYASEVFGGGYSRVKVQFGAPNNRAIFNVGAVKWTGLPAVTVTHVALWDVQLNGNFLVAFEMETAVRVLAGKSISYASQEIAISLD